jgi:glycosyltransferase involved in cell wall biosynthesis
MVLSILIPCLPEAESQNYLKRLRHILDPQIAGKDVEILTDDAPRSVPTGTKRNNLIARAQGEYIVQIDCDDTVPVYYVHELLKAIQFKPDVISFNGYMITDGANRRNFTIKQGEKYEERNGHYYRWPNHLCCWRKSIIQNIKFQPIWVQEDYLFSLSVQKANVIKHAIHLEMDMYCYDFKTNKRKK